MLGGGVWVTQNKMLPGSYINVVTLASVVSTPGLRGAAAIALPLNKAPGTVIEITKSDFIMNCEELTGVEHNDDSVIALREIFCHATKVYVYDLGVTDETQGTTAKTASDAITALEPYEFNIICAYTSVAEDISTYITTIKSWRDEYGKKCQLVVYNADAPNYEGIINVVSTVSDENADAHALVAWTAGVQAGCAINASCTNMLYDGEYTVITDKTQSELEDCVENGQLVFHLVYGNVRILTDINSLTETTLEKGEDFKSNQTMRVVDQISNDIAKEFNLNFLGKVPNNPSGRVSFWGVIIKYLNALKDIQAIEAYESSKVTVEPGVSGRSIVVYLPVTPTNAMEQLYMTVEVQ